MSRPRKALRSIAKHVTLPEDLVALVDLELYSEAIGRVPYSAWTGLLDTLLTQWLKDKGVDRGQA